MSVPASALDDLRRARTLLDTPSLAARVSNLLGTPIDRGFELLPPAWSEAIARSTQAALRKALGVALATIADNGSTRSRNLLHKIAVTATGAGAGAFGLAALALELPLSTTVMLRSIADIARSEGESIKAVEGQLACLEVFALGARPRPTVGADTSYFAVRLALARVMTEAAEFIAERGIVREGAPALVRLVAEIGSRFGVVVSEKAAAQALPVVGAAAGAVVNVLFLDHFQDVARGHFIVRRLERGYGTEAIRAAYERQ